MARPRAKIDKKQFESLCGMQCTRREICSFFECDAKTLNEWCRREYGKTFSGVFEEKRGRGLVALRRNQMRLSESNAPMAIWLGKQYLGQQEHPNAQAAATKAATEEQKDAVTIEDLYGGE